MGTPTHDPASACSEMSIAALVLAKHARTGLVRAMRGEGGLVLAGMAKKASGEPHDANHNLHPDCPCT